MGNPIRAGERKIEAKIRRIDNATYDKNKIIEYVNTYNSRLADKHQRRLQYLMDGTVSLITHHIKSYFKACLDAGVEMDAAFKTIDVLLRLDQDEINRYIHPSFKPLMAKYANEYQIQQ